MYFQVLEGRFLPSKAFPLILRGLAKRMPVDAKIKTANPTACRNQSWKVVSQALACSTRQNPDLHAGFILKAARQNNTPEIFSRPCKATTLAGGLHIVSLPEEHCLQQASPKQMVQIGLDWVVSVQLLAQQQVPSRR